MPTRPARARHHRRIAWWALALTATLTLSATACGGDDDPGPTADDTTTSTTAEPTTTTVPPEKLPAGHFIDLHLPDDLTAEEKEVAEAYRDALEAFARALRVPTRESDEVQSHHVGEALTEANKRLRELSHAGEAVRLISDGRITAKILDANITPKGAGALVCLADGSESYDTTTGKATSTAGSRPHEVVVVLVADGGRWKLSQSLSRETSDGKERPCDVSG